MGPFSPYRGWKSAWAEGQVQGLEREGLGFEAWGLGFQAQGLGFTI
jgi:hypothetical protein